MKKQSIVKFRKYLPIEKATCDCWEWQGALHENGYGAFWDGRNQVKAHRFSYQYFTGRKIKPQYVIMHTCDNPKCVNPNHLVMGTHKENSQDSVNKGRNCRGEKCHSSIVKEDDAIKIISEYRKPFTMKDECKRLSEKYNLTWRIVQHIIRGTTWKHLNSYRKSNQNLPN